MCGIVGLFIKEKSLEPKLGGLLANMLITMTDRGPDSAGFAIYCSDNEGHSKLTIQSDQADRDFASLATDLSQEIGSEVKLQRNDTHAVLEVASDKTELARTALAKCRADVRIMSGGAAIEIYKEVGLPKNVAQRFQLSTMSGSHGVGHTRMATESAVTTDLSLIHI